MRISDWSSDVCSSDLSCSSRASASRNGILETPSSAASASCRIATSCGSRPVTIRSRMTSKTCSESVRTTMLMGSSPRSRDLESLPEHVVAINQDGVQSGGDRRPFDRRHDCGQIADTRFGFDPPDEVDADIAFVDDGIGDVENTGRQPVVNPITQAYPVCRTTLQTTQN